MNLFSLLEKMDKQTNNKRASEEENVIWNRKKVYILSKENEELFKTGSRKKLLPYKVLNEDVFGFRPHSFFQLVRKEGTVKVFCGPFGWQYEQTPFTLYHPISLEHDKELRYKQEISKLFKFLMRLFEEDKIHNKKALIPMHGFFKYQAENYNINRTKSTS